MLDASTQQLALINLRISFMLLEVIILSQVSWQALRLLVLELVNGNYMVVVIMKTSTNSLLPQELMLVLVNVGQNIFIFLEV